MTVMSIDPEAVRAIVRQKLEERFGVPSEPTVSVTHGTHWSHLVITSGPECSDDLDLPIRKPCLIEPHHPCYNSGYCKTLGH